jgi:hypothetical protein
VKTIAKSDEFILEHGADAFEKLPEMVPEPEGPYLIDRGRLCRVRRTRDGRVIDPLCNFVARVTEKLILDDGAEVSRAFTIDGKLDTGATLPTVSIPAALRRHDMGHRAVGTAGHRLAGPEHPRLPTRGHPDTLAVCGVAAPLHAHRVAPGR